MSNERALFQMYEEILKFNKKKMKNLIREWSKVLKRHFIKEDMQMTITIWKVAQQLMSLGKYNLKPSWYNQKQPWDATTQVTEWPQPRTLTTPGAGEGVEGQERPSSAGGAQRGTAPLEDRLPASYKTKH